MSPRPNMSNTEVPFYLPDIGEGEINAVVECLRSGWLTTGNRCAKFESDFAEFIGGNVEAIAVSSCTAALEIALATYGIGPGDEIITTDFTFTATAMSAVRLGARPVLVDINPETLNIDYQKIEDAVTSKTKAILPVHFGGLACDMDTINDIAKRRGLKVIEDAAHALTASWKGRPIGQSTSDATAFSFYATKTITTGEGGMITVADPDLAKRMRILRLHGIDRDVFSRYLPPSTPWRYEVVASGFKSNLTDLAAAIGIVQLKRARGFHERRAQLWANYNEQLSSLPVLLPTEAPGDGIHARHLYTIRLRENAPVNRDDFIASMRQRGINCSVHFVPLHLHAYWRNTLGISQIDFPEAQKAFETVVSLPLFTSMSDEMQQYVVDVSHELLS
jgi:dTDP-4-amino-4,6-dideoxygalactose transaminase